MGNLLSWLSSGDDNDVDFPLIEENAVLQFNRAFGIKPKSLISVIRVSTEPDFISLGLEFDEILENSKTQKSVLIKYKKGENGCIVELIQSQVSKEKLLENQDFFEIFWECLEVILRTQKSILKELEVKLPEESEISKKFLKNVKKTLEYRNSPLPVKTLIVKSAKIDPIHQILPLIDAEVLRKIAIIDDCERFLELDLDKLSNLDQWKKSENLEIMNFDITISLEIFSHFSKIELSIKTLHSENVISLKQELLSSSTINYFKINYQNLVMDEPETNLDDIFGDPSISINQLEKTEKRWFFRNRDSEEIVLIKLFSNSILFERVKMSDLSEFSDFVIVVN